MDIVPKDVAEGFAVGEVVFLRVLGDGVVDDVPVHGIDGGTDFGGSVWGEGHSERGIVLGTARTGGSYVVKHVPDFFYLASYGRRAWQNLVGAGGGEVFGEEFVGVAEVVGVDAGELVADGDQPGEVKVVQLLLESFEFGQVGERGKRNGYAGDLRFC